MDNRKRSLIAAIVALASGSLVESAFAASRGIEKVKKGASPRGKTLRRRFISQADINRQRVNDQKIRDIKKSAGK